MAVSARSASWDIPADRTASAVWLGVIWLGMIIGFAIDFPGFLKEKPPAPALTYLHAAVFVGWLLLITAQVIFVLRGSMTQHRRLGSKLGYLAALMVPLGLAAALTAAAQAHAPPQFLALQFVDILGFITFVVLGLKYRRQPAAHKRLMMLSMVALGNAGFARATEYLVNPKTPLGFFVGNYYGDALLVAAMFGWDLWRRRRVHWALLIGGTSLVGAELLVAFAYFNPTCKVVATSIVRAWGYTGGMP